MQPALAPAVPLLGILLSLTTICPPAPVAPLWMLAASGAPRAATVSPKQSVLPSRIAVNDP
jgi:hypothetical protein